jgi:hypothetical protein
MNIDVLSLDQNDAANAEDSIRVAYDVSGTNIMVMVDDNGQLRHTHQEFLNAQGVSRVDNQYVSSVALGDHANHVAGTIGALGKDPRARGVAPDCSMVATEAKLTDFVSSPSTYVTRVLNNNVAVSNHSWGGIYGTYQYRVDIHSVLYTKIDWTSEFQHYQGSVLTPSDEFLILGKYNVHSQVIDQSLYDVSTSTLSVWAAGNARTDEFISLGNHTFDGTGFTDPFIFSDKTQEQLNALTNSQIKDVMYSTSTETIVVNGVNKTYRFFMHPKTGGTPRKYYLPAAMGNSKTEKFDILVPTQVTKNSLVVGSVGLNTRDRSVLGADPLTTTPLSNLSLFSSTGPTDDGRIKPELVADGSGVFGVKETANTAYGLMTGTSMAAPVVTGCAALVNELYRKKTGKTKMSAAMAKAVLISNAYRGNAAPNNATGYGMVDASSALGFLSEWANSNHANSNYVYLEEKRFTTPGTDVSFEIYPRATDVSTSILLCWTDPSASNALVNTNVSTIDASHSMIMNKLRVECLEGAVHTADVGAKRAYYPWYVNVNDPAAAARNEVQAGGRDSVYGIDAPYDNTKLIEFTARSTNKHIVKISTDPGQTSLVPNNTVGQDYAVVVSGAAAEAIPIRVKYVGTSSPFFEFYQNGAKMSSPVVLSRGNTYKFIIESGNAGHPFWLGESHRNDPALPATIVSNTAGKSKTNGLVSADEYVTVNVASTYPTGSGLKYYCTAHSGMVKSFAVSEPRRLSAASAVADPYVYPLLSSAPYKLPDVEATYCMYTSRVAYGGTDVHIDVHARVERASPSHQRRMREYAINTSILDDYDDVVTDGFFFRWLVVRVDGAWAHLNLVTREVRTNGPTAFRFERRAKAYTTKHFEEECECLRIWLNGVPTTDGCEPSYVDAMFFENPHLENGIELAPFSLGSEAEGKRRGRDGLLVRAPSASNTDVGAGMHPAFSDEKAIFDQETWHYVRSAASV